MLWHWLIFTSFGAFVYSLAMENWKNIVYKKTLLEFLFVQFANFFFNFALVRFTVRPRIARIQIVQIHYNTINFLVPKHSILWGKYPKYRISEECLLSV